jgi:hypothetical protein
VVEQIEHLRLDLDRVPLGDVQRPRQAEVNFVDPWSIECVVSDARYWSGAGDPRGGVARRLIDRAVV